MARKQRFGGRGEIMERGLAVSVDSGVTHLVFRRKSHILLGNRETISHIYHPPHITKPP